MLPQSRSFADVGTHLLFKVPWGLYIFAHPLRITKIEVKVYQSKHLGIINKTVWDGEPEAAGFCQKKPVVQYDRTRVSLGWVVLFCLNNNQSGNGNKRGQLFQRGSYSPTPGLLKESSPLNRNLPVLSTLGGSGAERGFIERIVHSPRIPGGAGEPGNASAGVVLVRRWLLPGETPCGPWHQS